MLRQQCILTALAIRLITLSGTNIYIPLSVTYFLASFKLIDIRRVQVKIGKGVEVSSTPFPMLCSGSGSRSHDLRIMNPTL